MLLKMVQKYHSPIRVYKYPFELVMAVSTFAGLPSRLAGEMASAFGLKTLLGKSRKSMVALMTSSGFDPVTLGGLRRANVVEQMASG